MQNDSLTPIVAFDVSYDFNLFNPIAEDELPGFQVYFSTEGEPGTWQMISDLSGTEAVGRMSAIVLPVTPWQLGQRLYLLWVDDNALRGGVDPGYTIDNFAISIVSGSPTISTQPQHQIVTAGSDATFSVRATGAPPLTYQWRRDGLEISAGTNSSLVISNAQPLDNGAYDVVVANSIGAVTSQPAFMTVEYRLTTIATGGGTVLREPAGEMFPPNTIVTLTAVPVANQQFLSWSGDASGSANPLLLTMTTNLMVTGNFVPISVPLEITTQGVGRVVPSPDLQEYAFGEPVLLTAIPNVWWYAFSHWTDGVMENPRTIAMGLTNRYTAVFLPTTPLETLTFGGVSRTAPVGMPAIFVDEVFTVESSASVRAATTVLLHTTFPNGTILFTLDGSEPDFSSRIYYGPFPVKESVTLRAIAYNADFTQAVPSDPVEIVILPTLSTSTAGGGSVAMDPPDGAYLGDGTATVTAMPAPGWTFLQWLGDATGTNPVAGVSMSRNKCVRAVFGTTLGTTVVGSGSVVRSPAAEWYPYGTPVRLTAVPQAGNYFALWGNAASGTNNPLHFTITSANPTVTAVFATLPANQQALTVLPDGFGQVNASPRANRYTTGASVTLTAVPDAGQSFLSWSGDASGTQNPLTVTMTASKLVRANFTQSARLEVLNCGGAANGAEIQLLLTGEFGRTYVIEAATTLTPGATDWSMMAEVTATHGAVQFNDPFVTNRTQRFYRARSAP